MTTASYTEFSEFTDFQLPWQAGDEENKRFRRFLINGLIAFLVISIAVSWLPVIEQTVNVQQTEQLELTRVILEPKILPEPKPEIVPEPEVVPVPPVPTVLPVAEVVPVPPAPEVISEPEPVPVQTPPIVQAEPVPEPEPVDVVQQAREQAQVAGVMAFQDDLQAMRDAMAVSSVTTSDLTRSNAKAEQVERNIITADALVASGGIETSNLSRDSGGVALSGHQNTVIDVPQGAVSGSGTSAKAPGVPQNYSGRSDEEVRRVMDSNKSVIYALYNRALRQDPTLEGRFMFEMVIEPDGSISSVKTLSSELNDIELEDRLLARIALINFPSAGVSVTRVNYSFDFIPH